MPALLTCQSFTKSFGTHLLFKDITLAIEEGERLGLIGPNGAGKSTLLKCIAAMEEIDDGTRVMKRGLRIGYVPQDSEFPHDQSAEEVLAEALRGEQLEDQERARRISMVLGKLGFSPESASAHTATLSGGWRKRTAIARELVREPDLLLLDEPTNHLDLEGILWLEKLLKGANFAFIMVSHDRYFLENVANRVIELSRRFPGGYFSSTGNYSGFLAKREEFLEGQMQTQRALASKVRREIEWLRRGPPARTTKSRARIDSAGRLIDELAEVKGRNNSGGMVKLDFNSTDRQANKLIVLKNVSKAFGEKRVIDGLNLTISPGMRLGLVGANGSGKSTVLKMLAEELHQDSGEIIRAEKLRVEYFDQNREQLDPEMKLAKALAPEGDAVTFRGQQVHVSAWARRFLFDNEQLIMPLKNLSGGERARVLLARMMLRPADVLLLDEPTNDLDIPSLEVLESSLEDFPGAIVLVTHDRFLLQSLSTDLLGLDGTGRTQLFTDYKQWENALFETQRAALKEQKNSASKSDDARPSVKTTKRLNYKEQQEWDQMEAAIMKAEADLNVVQVGLEDPKVSADPQKLMAHCHALADAQEHVETLFKRWAELEEKQK